MSRVAKRPIVLPREVTAELDGRLVRIRGRFGSLELEVPAAVDVLRADDRLHLVSPRDLRRGGAALAGTVRALLSNMVRGVSERFSRRLLLVGVGYRVSCSGGELSFSVGRSHPLTYRLPPTLSAECPSPSELVIAGPDKQLVGRVAAELRALCPPEPYKGKGIRYAEEHPRLKESRKR